MTNILIQNGFILTLDDQNNVYAPGWVAITGDRIADAGPGQPPETHLTAAERVIEAANIAVLPGLINAHTHLSQTFMRGLGDDKALLDWLKQIMWPLQAAMTVEDMRLASLVGLVENLRCGATSVAQHHKLTARPAYADAVAEAAQTVGVRLQLARGWVDLGAAAEPVDEILAETTRLYERWHDQAWGRITVAFGPMAAWRCSDDTLRTTVELARRWGLPTHIHVAEARDEIELMKQRNGRRHIEWLHELGLLGPDFQLVHCVHVTQAEIDLIAASGAVVIHCPVSNMFLASGMAPVTTMLAQGIPVALGTDGPASHNCQDILETMKIAALLAKIESSNPIAVLPADIITMATSTGARLLGRTDLGSIRPGMKADLTLVNLDTARSMPVHSPASALVYNATGPDVHTVMVDGQVLLDAGRVTMLDEEALLAESRTAARRLMKRASL